MQGTDDEAMTRLIQMPTDRSVIAKIAFSLEPRTTLAHF